MKSLLYFWQTVLDWIQLMGNNKKKDKEVILDRIEVKELAALIAQQHRIIEELQDINCELREANASLREIVRLLTPSRTVPTSISMTQQGEQPMNFKILPGATGTFSFDLAPVGSAFPPGTVITWTSDGAASDVSAPIPSPADATNPEGRSVSIASSATPVASSFNLTVSVTFTDPANPAGGPITLVSGPNPVAIGPGTPPPPPVPTSITMTQLS